MRQRRRWVMKKILIAMIAFVLTIFFFTPAKSIAISKDKSKEPIDRGKELIEFKGPLGFLANTKTTDLHFDITMDGKGDCKDWSIQFFVMRSKQGEAGEFYSEDYYPLKTEDNILNWTGIKKLVLRDVLGNKYSYRIYIERYNIHGGEGDLDECNLKWQYSIGESEISNKAFIKSAVDMYQYSPHYCEKNGVFISYNSPSILYLKVKGELKGRISGRPYKYETSPHEGFRLEMEEEEE